MALLPRWFPRLVRSMYLFRLAYSLTNTIPGHGMLSISLPSA
jgi:hypothetical protein